MAKKILLADDSVTIQKVVSITLAHEDFDLTIVDNGSKAVAKAKEIRPDVILLDVVMPDKDGYQVCQEIKGNAELRNIPIILLTGTFEPFDADRAAEVGADDFIKKPFESHTLINKVKEMAAKSGIPREKPVDISGVDIGFETPVEGGYGEKPTPKRPPIRAWQPEAELETPWETKRTGSGHRSVKEQETEDIWSVEEFEDITGSKGESKAPEKAARPQVVEKAPAPREGAPAKGPAVSDDFFVQEEKARDVQVGDFELGEEISEDELEKFLEEEGTDTKIAIEEVSAADDIGISEAADPLRPTLTHPPFLCPFVFFVAPPEPSPARCGRKGMVTVTRWASAGFSAIPPPSTWNVLPASRRYAFGPLRPTLPQTHPPFSCPVVFFVATSAQPAS